MQLKQALEGSFPGIEVQGGNYPVPAIKVRFCWCTVCSHTGPKLLFTILVALQARLAQLVMVVQFGIIGIMLFGDKVFPAVGMQPPDMYEQVRDKKFAVGQFLCAQCEMFYKLSRMQQVITRGCTDWLNML